MKRWLVKMGFYSGVVKLMLKLRSGGGFRVLMYHHVTENNEMFLPHVTARVFSRQMEYLHREYRVLDLDDIIRMLGNGDTLPNRAVALTFDDGYEDVYRNAFPILKKYNLPATVFVSTGFIDGDRLPWTDELAFLFKNTDKPGLEIEEGEGKQSYLWRNEAEKLIAFQKTKGFLKTILDSQRKEIFQRIKDQLTVKDDNPVRIMNSSIIREMTEAEISFGAHTVHHPILTRIPPRQAQEEIVESKHRLESIIGQEVKGFCYPNGGRDDLNDVIKGMVQHAGYQYACTTIDGINSPDTDLYALKRLWTSEESLPHFAARLLRRWVEKD